MTTNFTGKKILIVVALLAMAGSAAYWWGVQSVLTQHWPMAAAYTAILTVAPPALMSFLIPWSPGGMLLQKINARTWGYPVIVACVVYFLYYSYHIQWSWWTAQQVVAESNLVYQQVLIGIIGFIVIPALLWTPITSEELVDQVRQAHLVKRYELQTQADIAILRATLLRAQEQTLRGFLNLAADERVELRAMVESLQSGIEATIEQMSDRTDQINSSLARYDELPGNKDVREVLAYLSDSLYEVNQAKHDEPQPQPQAQPQPAQKQKRNR